jgi:hypothetical protein
MAKTNVSTTVLLAWDEYRDKLVEQALPSIYDHASKASKEACTWYWESIRTKRRASQGVWFVTLSMVILGTVLPILAGLITKSEIRLIFTQSGVAALAIGGLLQVADRVFGWSSGWLRYITTVTAMESSTRKFELEWAGYILNKSDRLNHDDKKALFDLAKRFEEDIAKLQSDETDKWVTEFNSSVALLGELIKSQRESGDKAAEAARAAIIAQQTAAQSSEKAKQTGAVELTIVHKAGPTDVTIAIDDKSKEEFFGTVWSKLGLNPGQHTVSVTAAGATPQTIKKVFDILPGGVARVEISFS